MKARRIGFIFLVLLLASVLCAAFPAGEDQPAQPAATAPVAAAYPPPVVYDPYPPPPVDPPPAEPDTNPEPTKSTGERLPNDPTPLPTRGMFIHPPLLDPIPTPEG